MTALYVSCWGTGELKQYDVTDPFHPREARSGSAALSGAWLTRPGRISRWPADRRWSRYLATASGSTSPTRSTGAWDEQFYPDGVGAWMTKLDVTEGGGIGFDERFFVEGEAFRGRRPHQVRLEGGDASSDSYCYSSS